jgi:hypothetical protein
MLSESDEPRILESLTDDRELDVAVGVAEMRSVDAHNLDSDRDEVVSP